MDNQPISPAPQTTEGGSTRGIMLDVIIALMPALCGGVIIFGWRVLAVVSVCLGSAVISEFLYCLLTKKTPSVTDLSASVTGIILGLSLPPAVPLWVGAAGAAVAIIIFKEIFGGLGHSFVNPAMAARMILLFCFPTLMTSWADPCAWMNSAADTVASATPLAGGSASYWDMFLGLRGGCIGETCIMLLLCGGLYLVARRVICPIIPLCFIGTVAAAALIIGEDPLIWVMSGGVVFTAVFMATDRHTCPATNLGRLIFGFGCGLFTVIIRLFGILPEGVSFALLLMNVLTPYIDMLFAKKPVEARDNEE